MQTKQPSGAAQCPSVWAHSSLFILGDAQFHTVQGRHIHMNTKHATLAALTCDCAVGSTIHIYKYNGGGLQMWSPFAFAALESGHHLRDFQAVLQ